MDSWSSGCKKSPKLPCHGSSVQHAAPTFGTLTTFASPSLSELCGSPGTSSSSSIVIISRGMIDLGAEQSNHGAGRVVVLTADSNLCGFSREETFFVLHRQRTSVMASLRFGRRLFRAATASLVHQAQLPSVSVVRQRSNGPLPFFGGHANIRSSILPLGATVRNMFIQVECLASA